MLVATFGPSTEWQGREIIWDLDHFILVGHGAIPAAGLLDYDRRGQLVWADPGYRTWAVDVDRWETGGRAAASRSAAGFSGASGAASSGGPAPGAAPSRRFPTWGIVVLAVAGVLLVISVIIAVTVPQFLMRTGETLTKDFVVEANVRSLQTGIESFAADHGGAYPSPGEVNAIDMSRYISVWPVNPYTDLPMSDGGGVGNFRYDVSADGGAYKILGYGRDGSVVIELSGGTGTSV
jgi:type II secretory pathway pseudopilin PulG